MWSSLGQIIPCHQGSGLLLRSDVVANRLATGSAAFIWKLCCHWLRGLRQRQGAIVRRAPGPWFNVKMSCYQCRKCHCGENTFVTSSHLHNEISYTIKMISLYWINPFFRETSCETNLFKITIENDHFFPDRKKYFNVSSAICQPTLFCPNVLHCIPWNLSYYLYCLHKGWGWSNQRKQWWSILPRAFEQWWVHFSL